MIAQVILERFDSWDDEAAVSVALSVQLQRWVIGESIHLGDRASPRSQCVPDFSCCRPPLKQPEDVRRAFAEANEAGRHRFLMTFLGSMIADATAAGGEADGARVHVAGAEPE